MLLCYVRAHIQNKLFISQCLLAETEKQGKQWLLDELPMCLQNLYNVACNEGKGWQFKKLTIVSNLIK